MTKSIMVSMILLLLVPVSNQSYTQNYNFNRLEDTIRSIMSEYYVPGLQLAITTKDSVIWHSNLGYADYKNQKEVSDETMFRIGSVSKSFAAVAIMKLVEEGKISLNDKLKDLAPEVPFENKWEKTHPVRLVHLLEHTTGFGDLQVHDYAVNGQGWTTLQGIQYNPVSRTCRWKPGTHSSYCNAGPAIAAYVVEKITGKVFEDYIDEIIFTPLGMHTSSYYLDETVKDRLALGYLNADYDTAKYWHIIVRAAGSINSTALEMTNYIRFYLSRGSFDSTRILWPESIERMEQSLSTLAGKSGITGGYGLYLANSYYKGIKKIWHGGGMEGFLTSLTYFPELDIGYILVVNASNDGMFKIEKILNNFIVSDDIAIPVNEFSNQVEIKTDIPGWYRSATSRNEFIRFIEWPISVMKIASDDGKYVVKSPFDDPLEAFPVNENSLITERKGQFLHVVYLQDESGKEYVQIPERFANFEKASGFGIWLTFIVGIICLALIATNPLVSLFWMLFRMIKELRPKLHWSRIISVLTVLCLVVYAFIFKSAGGSGAIDRFGTLTPASFSLFVMSILFAAGSVLSVYGSYVSGKAGVQKSGRIYTTIISWASLIVAAYLFYWDVIGWRSWAG